MKAKDIVTQLEETVGIIGPPVRLVEAIAVALQDLGLPEIQAAEKAERWEAPVRKLIEEEETKPNPKLAIVASAEHLVAGYCHINPLDSPEVATAKLSRLNIAPLLQEIRRLSFKEFEQFGACVLKELGAKSPRVTRQSNDQGIDFYGVLSLGQNSFLPPPFGQLAHDVRLLFAGQAKHYAVTHPVGPELIRELVGSVSLARYKAFTDINTELFEGKDIELLPFNPLVVLFFTTGRFTSGALELAQKSGVIAKSGEELAVFLADKGIGMRNDKSTIKFDREKFHKWLSA